MFRPRSNSSSNARQTPGELDDTPLKPILEFDYSRSQIPGTGSWPSVHFGQKFGPSLIRKALKAGLYVMAEIDDAPRPVAVNEARWAGSSGSTLEVLTLEGYRIPSRVWTLTSLKGFQL